MNEVVIGILSLILTIVLIYLYKYHKEDYINIEYIPNQKYTIDDLFVDDLEIYPILNVSDKNIDNYTLATFDQFATTVKLHQGWNKIGLVSYGKYYGLVPLRPFELISNHYEGIHYTIFHKNTLPYYSKYMECIYAYGKKSDFMDDRNILPWDIKMNKWSYYSI